MIKIRFFFLTVAIFFSLLVLPVISDTMFDKGKDVFINKASCGACHILLDAEAVGQIGPNLNDLKPETARIANAVTNGVGVMPAFEGMLLPDEIEAVSYYVFKSTNQ